MFGKEAATGPQQLVLIQCGSSALILWSTCSMHWLVMRNTCSLFPRAPPPTERTHTWAQSQSPPTSQTRLVWDFTEGTGVCEGFTWCNMKGQRFAATRHHDNVTQYDLQLYLIRFTQIWRFYILPHEMRGHLKLCFTLFFYRKGGRGCHDARWMDERWWFWLSIMKREMMNWVSGMNIKWWMDHTGHTVFLQLTFLFLFSTVLTFVFTYSHFIYSFSSHLVLLLLLWLFSYLQFFLSCSNRIFL